MGIARASRWFVAAGALFFLGVQLAIAAGAPRRTVVTLGLYGFVLHVAFGKAYALVPSYFERSLAWPTAPAIQWPLSVAGTAALALAPAGPAWLDPAGTALWAGSVAIFLGTLGWTIRDNPTGAATGTGDANAHRRPVDRRANAVVPVALGYLSLAVVAALAGAFGSGWLADQQRSHLLAAGTAALLVFGVGFRLFPRFLVAEPPRRLVAVVLLTGAVGPALLAFGLFSPTVLLVGGVVEAVAVLGFAVSYLVLFARSDRRRVGFYAVALGAVAGVAGVGLGLAMAVTAREPALVRAHYRLMLVGFLGLTVVGAAYQFYPPAVGTWPLASDRTALGSIALLGGGLGLQVVGALLGHDLVSAVGAILGVSGAALFAYLLFAAFDRRRGR
ncbi:hypothetical protein [Haloarcula salina]|uniref:Uncharacterized protein n=1 Tax=Haloarcula salina TaxID=1429914 RepID=A0AA41KHF2_9EURY|nr:hypothetical protein [Haloarcula salina]MBV0900548.1 hypothetical protein [Haloarcula salina]